MASTSFRGGSDWILGEIPSQKGHSDVGKTAQRSGEVTIIWKGLKNMWIWHVGTGFRGGPGSSRVMAGPDCPGGLFLPKYFFAVSG